jgi:hypothetical protein
MPTATATHTLEGPDLEALLARVPAELGADATIVAANKLRSGGLGGFFTKEVFEVVVEVPVGATSASAPTAGRLAADPQGAAPAEPDRRIPLADAPLASAPRVSTEAVGFAGVLDRMVRDAGAEDLAPRPVGPAFERTPAAPPRTDVIDDELDDDLDAPFEPLLPARVERPSTLVSPALPEPMPSMGVESTSNRRLPATTSPRPAAPVVPTTPALDQRWLAQVGIPTNLATHLTTVSDDPAVELFHLMNQLALPEPLPTGPGSVIAVVGRRAEALSVAETFAGELGTSPEDILVAASSFRGGAIDRDRRLSSIDVALERRRTWRRRRQPTIIAVESPLGRPRSAWATHLLDAVEPTMVWGVVDASRKAEDIRDWAVRLGGLDALAVTDLADTVSPATVLGVGVPVGLLDGHEATASRWAAILGEHLEVAA